VRYKFIILFGLVNLFADMTYEGGRSIGGAYLALLGANGFIVGLTAGLGELVGYAFRVFSSLLSDKTQKYWPIIMVGYFINLAAVPLLALAGSWQVAAFLIILERFGKSIRTPPRDALISFASKDLGRGLTFGLLEGLDQTGAVLGPLIVSLVLFYNGSYPMGFAVLGIPAIFAFLTLLKTKSEFPTPQHLEIEAREESDQKLPPRFWIYMLSLSFFAAGFVDFPLISFHFKHAEIFSDVSIPLVYALAMGSSGIFALLFGRLYDLMGIVFFIPAIFLASLSPLLLFLGNSYFAVIGIIFWSFGMGAQESIMLAYVADIVPKNRRGYAFGLLYLFLASLGF
jgi:Major Facilitator Superfamily.